MTAAANRMVVERFWEAMATNDFRAAGALLHDDYRLEWPQSGEVIRGRDNFAAMNENYPSHGRWRFTVVRLVGGDDGLVVSEVLVSDGVTEGRAITFSTIAGGRIVHQTEYWPDPFEAPAWRTPWTERP